MGLPGAEASGRSWIHSDSIRRHGALDQGGVSSSVRGSGLSCRGFAPRIGHPSTGRFFESRIEPWKRTGALGADRVTLYAVYGYLRAAVARQLSLRPNNLQRFRKAV